MASRERDVVTETFAYDGGRTVTVSVPSERAEAVVFAADGGWHGDRLVAALAAAGDVPPTLLVAVQGKDDDEGRFAEYVPVVDPPTFAAHERFFVDDVGAWVRSRFGVDLAPARTAVWGASLGGELALALAVRHPDAFGSAFSASPGGGYRPPDTGLDAASSLRTYLVAGELEPFFAENARRWFDAVRAGGGDAVLHVRPGDHGGDFWYEELPRMVAWAFGPG